MRRIFLIALLLSSAPLLAQKSKSIVKVGCVDYQRIVDRVAGDKLLKNFLEDRKGEYMKGAEERAKNLQAKKEILTKEGGKLDAERVKSLKADIAKLEDELKAYIGEKSEALKQKEEALANRAQLAIYEILKDVAVKNGYAMIVEKGSVVLYVDNEIDITDDVIKALDKEREAVLRGLRN